MKRALGILVIGVLAAGCGQGVVDEVTVLDGDIQSQKDPIIQNTLKIIAMGEVKGDAVMQLAVNQVLQSQNINYFYSGLKTLSADSGDANAKPNTDGPSNCPYVGNLLDKTTGSVSCNFIKHEIREKALLAVATKVNADRAVQSNEFKGNQAQMADYKTWYIKSVNNTVEISAIRLVDELRTKGYCDQNPTPQQSAYEKGRQEGIKLYYKMMNERLKDVGIVFNYPNNNGKKASNSTRYCIATLRQPTMQAATARIQSYIQAKPLCNAIGADPIEQSHLYSAYKDADKKYGDGIVQGLKDADKDAQQKLRKGGCCIASPLVLDLAGDGIRPTQKKVKFDLLSSGTKVDTAWIQGDDALLTLDRNGNGLIDDATELFGNDTNNSNGFDKLARYDANNDGRIDSKDPIYKRLRLWQDADGNGISTADELSSLPAMGVAAIELRYNSGSHVDVSGSQHRQQARFVRTAEFARALGSVGTITDVWFTYN